MEASFLHAIDECLRAIGTLALRHLNGHPTALPLVQFVVAEMMSGRTDPVDLLFGPNSRWKPLTIEEQENLSKTLKALAKVLPIVRQDSVPRDALHSLVIHLAMIGRAARATGDTDMAYNLCEIAYSIADVIDEAALDLAEELCDLADRDKRDQVGAALWRRAIQTVRRSIATQSAWIEAVDAVELAFNVPPDDLSLRRRLVEELTKAVFGLQHSPIEDLIVILPLQVPRDAISPSLRQQAVTAILEARYEPSSNYDSASARMLASVLAQTMVDDMRLRVTGLPHVRPSISWYTLTVVHRNLLAAVPLGKAFTADIERTGEFALSLAHEVAHAYTLLGPIGWSVAAIRAGVCCLEGVLAAASGSENLSAQELERRPPVTLPKTEAAELLASRQYLLARRASIVRSTWTCWLEGIAVYLELLCNPGQSQSEIIAPFEALRSLVDFDFEIDASESVDQAANRYIEQATSEFETFYVAAFNRHSRLAHLKTLGTHADSAVYVCGYVLIRSLVARWEATLGREITPVRAIKLLLDATRNGTLDAIPPLTLGEPDFAQACRAEFDRFVHCLAAIDRVALEAAMKEVAPDAVSNHLDWHGGTPTPTVDKEQLLRRGERRLEVLCSEIASVLGLQSGVDKAEDVSSLQEAIRGMMNRFLELNTLLPIGQDRARLLFLDEANVQLLVCPRTYAGTAAVAGDLATPRYSTRSLPLSGPEEVDRVRRGCATLRTARAMVSRVIALAAHPQSPLPRANTSYICVRLGGEWSHISTVIPGGQIRLGAAYSGFCDLMEERLGAVDQAGTTTLASLGFLEGRLRGLSAKASALVQPLSANGMEEVGYASCALALGTTPQAMRSAVERMLARPAEGIHFANHAWATGLRKPSLEREAALLTSLGALVFAPNHAADVVPYRE